MRKELIAILIAIVIGLVAWLIIKCTGLSDVKYTIPVFLIGILCIVILTPHFIRIGCKRMNIMRQNLISFAISIAAAVIFVLTLKYTGLSDVEATVSLLQIIWITIAYIAISYIIKILADRNKQAI